MDRDNGYCSSRKGLKKSLERHAGKIFLGLLSYYVAKTISQ